MTGFPVNHFGGVDVLQADVFTVHALCAVQEWSAEEIAQGLHNGSMKFAMESRSQRGTRGANANPTSLFSAKAAAASAEGEASQVHVAVDAIAPKTKV